MGRKATVVAGVAAVSWGAATWSAAHRLGRTYGSTPSERATSLPGDDIIARPTAVTDHAITVHAGPEQIWPWLVQMGWGRAGWYTARWVDRLLFPANGPSADRIVPELQHIEVGTFIPDGPPESKCGLIVEHLEKERALVLHSTTHLPLSWRSFASADWSWAFVLTPAADGTTRFHFRSRWVTAPWWLTLTSDLAVVPADFVMSRDMLRGVKERAERQATELGAAWIAAADQAEGARLTTSRP
ncbi:hypothetical protein Q6348_07415 [Isoptericola sp. b441]|uniref:SRPBCC family protein n=1 Tax=Actinotalea lenta TaxID=3064654 RepID=A0ABT9D833_9CELL|nr:MULTISPECIES: hypothetical protein [unclassified Isoptericola]MDO8107026.1 hypothetical protein [Isoptericola sp. b441]MDO8121264.1 hypothetical protein [Isoptericola sp. b490]